MVTRGTDGIYRSEPVETDHGNGNGALAMPVANDPAEAEAWQNWFTASFARHFAPINESWCRTVAEAAMTLIHERCAPLERQIKDLELKLASALGAIDVLRGKNAAGSFNIRGTYDELTAYSYLDVVALNGGSFVALKDAPGSCPGPDWQLLCSAGRRGPRGERGLMGPAGPAASPVKWLSFDSARMALLVTMSDARTTTIPLAGVFTNVTIDRTSYCVVFRMSDGAELRFSVREFFEQYDLEKQGR
jgi:hypothetical protein